MSSGDITKKKDPFESEALSSSNTEKSNPFVTLFSGASGVLGSMLGGKGAEIKMKEEENESPKSRSKGAQFNFSSVTSRDAFPATVWVCSSCGKSKELTGGHLHNKGEVRSDCWCCAKKRVFQLRTADGALVMASGASCRTTSPGQGGATRMDTVTPTSSDPKTNTVSPKLSFSTPPQQSGTEFVSGKTTVLQKAVGSSCARYGGGSVGQWRCSICDKTKLLEGDHLRGKSQVRSDCWPCARKRTFVFHSASEVTPPPATFNLSNTTGHSSVIGFPKSLSINSVTENSDKNSRGCPELPEVSEGKNKQQPSTSPERAAIEEQQLTSKLDAANMVLQFNTDFVRAGLASSQKTLRNCSIHGGRGSSAGVQTNFVQIPEDESSTTALGQLAHLLVSFFPSSGYQQERSRRLVVCCHDEPTFAAMSLYVASLQGFGSGSTPPCSMVTVLGPAYDKTTTEKSRNHKIVSAARLLSGPTSIGTEVQVSHQQSREALMPLYEATGWMSTSSVGMALNMSVEDDSIDRLVLCGPSVPYSQLKSQLF